MPCHCSRTILGAAAMVVAFTGVPAAAFHHSVMVPCWRSLASLTAAKKGPVCSPMRTVASRRLLWRMETPVNSQGGTRSFASTVNDINQQLEADDPVAPLVVTADKKTNLYSLSAQDLETLLVGWGQPKFRSKQLHTWLYDKGVDDFERMLDLPKDLRARSALPVLADARIPSSPAPDRAG
jgi:hypothetical protein